MRRLGSEAVCDALEPLLGGNVRGAILFVKRPVFAQQTCLYPLHAPLFVLRERWGGASEFFHVVCPFYE
jgi:hypothetical protein